MTRGERADLRSVAAAEIKLESGAGLGGGGTVGGGRAGCDDAVSGEGLMIMSAGRSMKDGPGRPYQHVRYPVCIALNIAAGSFDVGRIARFVCGVSRAM